MNKFWRRTQALKTAALARPTDRDGATLDAENFHALVRTDAQDRQGPC